MDDLGFSRTPDRLHMFSGSRAQQSEVVETMTCACGPYNLGGSTTCTMFQVLQASVLVFQLIVSPVSVECFVHFKCMF
jgi:hypothetical protein